jgi:transcriptional regulator with XRE-family HTH domain
MLITLGENIRAARDAAGLSQEAVGRELGTDADYIRDIEKGRTEPSLTRFVQLARTLGIDPAELLDGLDTPPA